MSIGMGSKIFTTRAEALEYAHDVNRDDRYKYGVREIETPKEETRKPTEAFEDVTNAAFEAFEKEFPFEYRRIALDGMFFDDVDWLVKP
jgi:hypothetical protein